MCEKYTNTLKKQLYYYLKYYKEIDEIRNIINHNDYTGDEKLCKIKDVVKQLKQQKHNDIVKKLYTTNEINISGTHTISELKEIIKNNDEKERAHKKSKYVLKIYHSSPEYKASINLSAYKRYALKYPELNEIYDNTEMTKIEKFDKIKEYMNKIKENKRIMKQKRDEEIKLQRKQKKEKKQKNEEVVYSNQI